MLTAAFVAIVLVAFGWVVATVRSSGSVADRAFRVAWQLAALSFLSAPETLIGERGEVAIKVGLGAMAALAVCVGVVFGDRSGPVLALSPWFGADAVGLAVAAGLSSSPDVAALRTLRAIVLFAVFGQVAARLDRDTLRQLFFQLTAGLAVVVAIGPIVAGGQAFHPLRAPVIRWALQAPLIGSGPHVVAAIGLGLVVATLWRWLDGDRPPVGSLPWSLSVGLPGAGGLIILAASQKRASWLALAVMVAVWLVLRHRRAIVPALAGIAVTAAALLAVGPLRDLWDRERSRPQIDNIASIRSAIFEASLDRFAQRPLIGDGLGVGNRELLIDVGQDGLTWASHSEVGAALAATGLIGLVVLVWGHGAGVRGAVGAWRDRADPLPIVVLAGSLTLLAFWRILQEPLIVGLAYYTIVFPLQGWRDVELMPGRWRPSGSGSGSGR